MKASTLRRISTGLVWALILGCGGSETAAPPGPPTVSTVSVTPGSDTIAALGVTRQFTAVAKDASGNTISGKSFTWQTSAHGVSSVDAASGVATAVANGTATITASVDGKTGQAAVTVAQDVASVSVTPGSAAVTALGATQQFAAAAKDANNSTCGITTGGATYCWGQNSSGEVGDGTSGNVRTAPPLVLGGQTFTSVRAGDFHSCGIASDGIVYCWGAGTGGQLGNGANANSNVPVRVRGG